MSLTDNKRNLVRPERSGDLVDVLDDERRELEPSDGPKFPRLITALPQPKDKRSTGLMISFVICVLVPTLLAAVYYSFIASPQYVSEFRFAVSTVTPTIPGQATAPTNSATAPSSGLTQALSSMLGPQVNIGSGTQDYLVVDYLKSEQAVSDVRKQMNVEALYERPQIDPLSRFPPGRSKEAFLRYWRNMVSARYDPVTGLAIAQVKAFSPQDAKKIADTLVTLSEQLVNDIALRSNLSAVKSAQDEVANAQTRLASIRQQISAFRRTQNVIDPTQSSVPTNTQLEAGLRQTVIQLQGQLDALHRQGLDTSPTTALVRSELGAAREQLAGVEAEVAKNTSNSQALVGVVSTYEQLNMQEQFAENLLVGALQTLEAAKTTAAQQLLFLTPYVRPALAERPSFPRKIRSTIYVFLIAAGLWLIGMMIFKSVRQQAHI